MRKHFYNLTILKLCIIQKDIRQVESKCSVLKYRLKL